MHALLLLLSCIAMSLSQSEVLLNVNVLKLLEELSLPKLLSNIGTRTELLSSPCAEDLEELLAGLKDLSNTGRFMNLVLPVLDSSAKLSPGILKGNLHQLGLMTECHEVKYTTQNRTIRGEYFRISLDVYLRPFNSNGSCSSLFSTIDYCLPKSCSSQELTKIFQGVPFASSNPICKVQTLNEPIPKVIAGTCRIFMALLLLTCVLASISDFYLPKEKYESLHKKKAWKCLLCFSLHRNIAEIFYVKEGNDGQIRPINCIRFFSISWIICYHTFGYLKLYALNPLDVTKESRNYFGLLFENVFLSVDSFFFVSGLLLTFLWFKSYKKDPQGTKSIRSWALFYVHRYIRISAPYYLIILFYTFVWQCLYTNMPAYTVYLDNVCRRNWWTNLLYLNNYIRHNEMCYDVSWYLSTDMQIFLFTPLLLMSFTYGPKIGYGSCLATLIVSIGIGIFQVIYFQLPPSAYSPPAASAMNGTKDYGILMYTAPYIRCQGYVMGMMVGYFLQSRRLFKVPKILNLLLYLLSFVVMLAMIFGIHDWANGTQIHLASSAAYNSLSKVGWCLALSWIVITCYYGPVNAFMSWPFWVPLGRLSFSAYLVHLCTVTYLLGSNQFYKVHTGSVDMFLNFLLPAVFYGFLAAVPWMAVCEMPFGKVEAILLGKLKKKEGSLSDRKSNAAANEEAQATEIQIKL